MGGGTVAGTLCYLLLSFLRACLFAQMKLLIDLYSNRIFQVGVNHYTECQVFRNLGRKSSSYNDLSFKLAAVVPLRLLIKIKNENPKGFSRLQFLLDSQTTTSSSFFEDDEISTKR